MALSRITIPGNGSTTQFVVQFPLGFLEESDITCKVGTEPGFRTITFITPTQLQISGAAPGVGIPVVFERTVSPTELVVDFTDGDIQNDDNLDAMQKQGLMLIHQVLDGRFAAFGTNIDAGGFKIVNHGPPTDPTDVATKGYIDQLITAGIPITDATNTDQLLEGVTNLYFTQARVRSTLLTGLSLATGTDVVSTDTILAAMGKIQNQLNNLDVIKEDADADILKANETETLSVGFNMQSVAGGNSGTSAYTPTYTAGTVIERSNTGAHTINAPVASGNYQILLVYTNSATAGAITFSGFNKTTTTDLTTVNGDVFYIWITVAGGRKTAFVEKV